MKKFKTWRVLSGLSQTELAKKAGVSQPAISKLEKGDLTYGYSAKTIKALADALEVPILDIEEFATLLGELPEGEIAAVLDLEEVA